MHTSNSWVGLKSLRGIGIVLAAAACLSATSAQAFTADLQAQSFGSTNWMTGHITGWAELDLIPTRVTLAGGPASNQTITVQFPHAGIQNLTTFTPSPNVTITAGPTLNAPANSGNWSYSFTVDLTDDSPGFVEFRMRLSAGAHRFTGSSLQVDGSPGLGKLFIFKPAAKAGAPDLGIVKTGPANTNPGDTIAYAISYSNRVSASTATGVQIVDTLPDSVSFIDCSGGCQLVGNTIIWDLGDVARGARGVVTYRVAVTNILTTGFSFQNDAVINEAEDDANYVDNESSVTTVVTGNCIPPSILMSPDDAAACAGDSVSFSVLANGSATLDFQWRKDGIAIPGATSDTLTLNSLSVSDSGDYDVVVSNLCGSQTSAPAHLIVNGALVTTQPASYIACDGGSAAFNVIASGDALTYQWRKDGVDIAGATNTLFEIASVTAADAGGYDVFINSACGSVTSDVATLTVNTPVAITADPAGAVVCEGDAVALSVDATGTEPLTYQWRKDGIDIPGATSNSFSIDPAAPGDSGSYDVGVSNSCGSAPSSPAAVTVGTLFTCSISGADPVCPLAAGLTYTADTDAANPAFSWSIAGNGEIVGDATSATVTVNATGTGSFTLTSSITDGPCNRTCELTVTAIDTQSPTITDCASDLSADADAGCLAAMPDFTSGVAATDDCSAVIIGQSPAPGTMVGIGSHTVTLTVSDASGNSAQCQATFTVVDTTLPTITCAADVNVSADSGQCSASGVNLGSPNASDNCGVASVVNDAPATFPVGTTVVTWTVTDNSGNTSACQQSVTVTDTELPQVSCPGDMVISAAPGATSATVSYSPATATDNCGVASVLCSPASDSSFDIGTTTISCDATDVHGNKASCSFTITVIAVNAEPVAGSDAYTVAEDDTLEVSAPGVLANDTDMENSPLTATLVSGTSHGTLTFNADGSFTYVPDDNYNGPDSFTYKASDGEANSNIATVDITVQPIDGAGDIDLYVKTATAKLSWAASNRDSISVRGKINPRGIKDNLSGATMALQINGVDVIGPVSLDARGSASIVSGSSKIRCRLKNKNGIYSLKVTGIDLRAALGLANATESAMTDLTVRLMINGANLEVPNMTAVLESPYKTTADKSTSVKFNFRKNRTMSGVFNANKTAGSVSSKGQLVTMRGAIEAEGGGPVVPSGDIVLHIGNAEMTLPFASLTSTGAGSSSLWSYRADGIKFALGNATHSFALAVASGDIGLPAAGPGAAMKHNLPLLIEVPTTGGTMYFESIIELKRTSETSTRLKR